CFFISDLFFFTVIFTISLFSITFYLSTLPSLSTLFFFIVTATTEIYTLSLHDALPIYIQEYHIRPIRDRHLTVCNHQMVRKAMLDRKSTRLNSSHVSISYAVFCLKKKKKKQITNQNRIQNNN